MSAPFERTLIIEPPADRNPAPSARKGTLTVLTGNNMGTLHVLTAARSVVGRGDTTELCLADAGISRTHACIHQTPGGYEIEDLGSSNGTRIDGEMLRGRRRLRSGDRIQVGPRVLLQFSLIDHLDRRVRELESLEAAGRLSAAVNHDLANLLSVFTCGLGHLSAFDPSTSLGTADVVECLDDMRLAASRASELTQNLSALVRRPDLAICERVELSQLCDELIRMMRRLLPEGITFEANIEPALWIVGNRAWIHQLLMNPCINAREAMPDGGVIRFEARLALEADVAGRGNAGVAQVLVSVSDTGVGISDDVMPRVFEPFFTTKRAGTASGLGLTTVARVANEHGGSVQVTSRPGRGTTVSILLPRGTYGQSDSLQPMVSAPRSDETGRTGPSPPTARSSLAP